MTQNNLILNWQLIVLWLANDAKNILMILERTTDPQQSSGAGGVCCSSLRDRRGFIRQRRELIASVVTVIGRKGMGWEARRGQRSNMYSVGAVWTKKEDRKKCKDNKSFPNAVLGIKGYKCKRKRIENK